MLRRHAETDVDPVCPHRFADAFKPATVFGFREGGKGGHGDCSQITGHPHGMPCPGSVERTCSISGICDDLGTRVKTNREASDVSDQSSAPYDVVVVGAGFSGMYMLYSLRRLGLRTIVIEAADDVGGTWYWNRYPGARCDVESMEYSYSFDEDLQQEWEWTERYSAQPEILEYAGHVADRFDLRRDIRFGTRVTRAWWGADSGDWVLEADTGENFRGHYCIMALGCLSVPRRPDFPGLDSFCGPWYHTGRWPHEPVDFSGLDVGIVGTGSSAIQSIPQIASEARHLTVFQRTPNFAVPAWNRPLEADEVREIKKNYAAFREGARWSHSGYNCDDAVGPGLEVSDNLRKSEMERRWQIGGFTVLSTFDDVNTSMEVNRLFVDFAHDNIRRRVNDPETARLLSPTDHPFGTKRLCVDIDYFEAYNRKNVTLVDISDDPIDHITPAGLVTEGGRAFDVDALVFATGFDAMTGPLLGIDIRGAEGSQPARQVGGRAAHLSRSHGRRISQHVHHHRPAEPLRSYQHDERHRTARGVDHGLPDLAAKS